ncbi:MAG TPA: hypothetical protein VIM63_12445 [Rhodoferax sp.]
MAAMAAMAAAIFGHGGHGVDESEGGDECQCEGSDFFAHDDFLGRLVEVMNVIVFISP